MKRIADVRGDVDAIAAVERLLDDASETLDVLGDEPGAEADVDAALIARAKPTSTRSRWRPTSIVPTTRTARS